MWISRKEQEAIDSFKLKFKFKELVEFNGISKPCKIRCDDHGIVESSRFNNVLNSKTGCPRCGDERTLKGMNKGRKTLKVVRKNRLLELLQKIEDAETPEDLQELKAWTLQQPWFE